jgi:omega-3 fatty acid desaturase (delta-15 desaturase)
MTSTVTTTTVITNNHNHHKSSDTPIRLPSIDEFRRAVPPECFVKSLPISLFYLVWDYAILIALYYSVHWIESTLGIVGLLAWYALMGMFGSALFIVGHDCGHGTFSDYQWVNDVFGHVAHAPLIAPFWPWQKSHRQHHTFTSHLHKDRGHPWVTLNDYEERSWIARHFSKLPISALFR